MLWILLGLFALVCLNRWRLTVLCIASAVVSVLLMVFAFLMASLMLFLYRPDVLRAWTLPHLWWDDLLAQDSLLVLFAGAPFLVVADVLRAVLHILFRHPHPLLWTCMISAGVLVVRLWLNAAAAVAARSSED